MIRTVGLRSQTAVLPAGGSFSVRLQLRDLNNQYEKSENDLKALQSVGQIVGEVLRQLTEEKFIVKVRKYFRF